MKIYKINEEGRATISTPIGEVGPIEANKIVRQGTIYGPKLCCTNTDQINKIGQKCITHIGPNVTTETEIYVDDIQNASSNVKQLKKAVDNLNRMEQQKGYLFNNEVNKTAILIVNKKRKETYNLKLNIKLGEIKLTNKYKYLGEWYNEKGDHSTSIEKRKEKIQYHISQVKLYGNEYTLGKYAMMTRIKIYKTMVVKALFHHIETWSKITKRDMEELEKIQSNILKKITEQRITTPYFGLLAELGIWPVETQIEYTKIMLLHNIITTKGERTLKEIIEEQIKNAWKGCWTEQTKEICVKYKIKIEEIRKYKKNELKKILKEKIKENLNIQLEIEKKEKTKLRFIMKFEQKQYLEQLQYIECIEMIKIKLNMIETKCNYKGKFKTDLRCDVCEMKNDTTEHIFECSKNEINITTTTENIVKADHKVVKEAKEVMERRKKLGYVVKIGEVQMKNEKENEKQIMVNKENNKDDEEAKGEAKDKYFYFAPY